MVITLIEPTNLRRPIGCSLAVYATMPESAQKTKSMIEGKNVWKATQKNAKMHKQRSALVKNFISKMNILCNMS